MKLNLLVIRTANIELLKVQYEKIGFVFDYHQHGNGPFHYASENDGFVFEIYPLTKSMSVADKSIRIGFDVAGLVRVIERIRESSWVILAEVAKTEWGNVAVIQDLDGRKIELRSSS